jgi:hypothetical protein
MNPLRAPGTGRACCLMTAIVLLLGAGVSGSAPVSHLIAPSKLRCDLESEPLAVADGAPQFSWRLTAAAPALHGVRQTAYQIEVAERDAGFARAIWESGKVVSAVTGGVAYAGPKLKGGHAYAWRVRVWDEQGQASGWSEAAHWTEAPVWHAAWIAAAEDKTGAMPLFRKSFRLTKPVKRAMLYVAGLGQDELRVNGNKVSSDELTPGWSEYGKTVYYDSYEISGMLKPGENVLGVLLGNGMYRVLDTPGRYTKFVGSFGEPKLTAQLHLEFADGQTMDVESDGSWKTRAGPITFSSTYGGEDYDARRELTGWDKAGFDDTAWSAVKVVDGPGVTLRPEVAPPVKVMRRYAPAKVTRPKPGVTVYDLGQNIGGWPEIRVSGSAGSLVKLIPGEMLNADGTVSQQSAGGGPQWFAYTLGGKGVEIWHPRFSYYGFRYVQVEGAGEADRAKLVSLTGEAVHSSSAQVGSFVSSDDLLNRIHALILRAIENNAVSLFTDCPHREKLGWLEEAHLLAPSMLYDFDFAGLYAATARNIADTQAAEGPAAGRIAEIAPQYVLFQPEWGMFDDSPEWSSAAVLAPWYLYQRSGDPRLLETQYEVMQHYVAYLSTRAKDGIIAYGLGDWYDIGPGEPGVSKLTTPGLTATAIEYQDLKVLERTAALLGKSGDSLAYARQAEVVRKKFNARFFDLARRRYDKGSQTAQAMPLSIGLVPEGEHGAVVEALVEDIRAHNNHVTAGDIGYHYVVDALLANGRSDVLLDMLERTDTPSYGYQLAQGMTSLTEAWDANPRSSLDHSMLGHAEEWFYRGLGGMEMDLTRKDPRRLVLRPAVVGKVAWVRARYESALGLVESNWRRGAAETVYDFSVPVNTEATIEVDAGAVTVNGVEAAKAAGVLSVKVEGGRVEIEVGSGSYRVRVEENRR